MTTRVNGFRPMRFALGLKYDGRLEPCDDHNRGYRRWSNEIRSGRRITTHLHVGQIRVSRTDRIRPLMKSIP